jgi:chaperonin GroEL
MSYSPKDLQFGEDARVKLIKGVTTMSKAVKSTLGPHGNTVLIESQQHLHGLTVTKDGVTVAKSIELLDPVENLAVRMMKEASDRTSTQAGDGTTTSIVLTEALVQAGLKHIKPTDNRTKVLRELVELSEGVIKDLTSSSTEVSDDMLTDIATISANNDGVIGGIIADTYKEVGKKGIVTVERSQGSITYSETTMGLKIDRGYSSLMFVNNQKKDECIMEDVLVLVADVDLSNVLQIEEILKPIIRDGKKLIVIAPCAAGFVNTIAANVVKNNLKMCIIPPPNFGYKKNELMQDIAISVGATLFSEATGDDLSHIQMSDLGHIQKCIVGKDSTIFINSTVRDNQAVIDERVAQLEGAYEDSNNKVDREFIKSRIAALTGGIGVIYVGGNTDLEQKEVYDRVDDAVCAVRSALEEGIVVGAGKALYDITVDSSTIAGKILSESLSAPLYQILHNAGLDASEVYRNDKKGEGLNLKTGEFGDLLKMGVIDPLKVTRCALQNAVSVAVTILSTNCIITMARSYETKD